MPWDDSKQCLPQMAVCASRVCALNLDGTTLIGAASAYATAATVSIGWTAVYDPGAEVKEKDGCGTTFIDVIAPPTLVRYDVDIDVWSTDPNYLSIAVPDGRVLTVPGSGAKGFGYPRPGVQSGQFSLEFWQQIINDNKQDPDFPWAWWVIPYLKNVQLQKRDANGTSSSHTVLKAEAYTNTNWFDGPGDDWPIDNDDACPIMWIPSDEIPVMDCTPIEITS